MKRFTCVDAFGGGRGALESSLHALVFLYILAVAICAYGYLAQTRCRPHVAGPFSSASQNSGLVSIELRLFLIIRGAGGGANAGAFWGGSVGVI